MKLGILGGSFNPIHLGHLVLAQEARDSLGLERVFFIPCALSPHKSEEDLLEASHRAKMVRLAIQGNPSFEFSDLEIKRGGMSYTVETVRAFRKTFPSATFYLLIGSDALPGLSRWKEVEELYRLCQVVVAERPRFPAGELPGPLMRLVIPEVDISSRDIRERLKQGKSVRYLVPEPVREYLERDRLIPRGR